MAEKAVKAISVTSNHPLSSDTDEETSTECTLYTSSSDSFVPDRKSSIIGMEASSSSSDDDPPSAPVINSAVARWTHPVTGRVYIPEHLAGLIPQDLLPPEQFQLAQTLSRYKDVFVGPDGVLGRTNVVKHDIQTGDSRPIKHAPRRMGPHQNEIVSQELDKMLKSGVVTPSDSPWSSPVVLVRKKDGTIRFCVDNRRLNNVTIKDAYPLPNIEDAVNTLSGSKYFCTLDLASGYW